MKEMKRILCLLLCFVMVVGLVPAQALALTASEVFTGALAAAEDAEVMPADGSDGNETIYLLAGGDYQEGNSDGTTLHVNSSENVTNILTAIYDAGYTTMDGFLCIGDYDGTDHNNATNVANGIDSLMTTIQAKYPDVNHDNSILVQGNHDNMDSRIDATGGHEFEGYSVYVLNEDDYVNGGGTQSGVQTLANNLKTWLNNKIGEGYDAPIFVTAHVPLHYSPRTQVQGDGKYAKYIVDVLNDAGKNGLNIIFLHGHDHAYGCDNYLGGEAIYRAKGDSLYVADPSDASKFTTEVLNFTYMNAGYTGYYNETGYNINERDDSKLTMTVFAITDNEVKVERYSKAGVYSLSSQGRDGYYSNESITASSIGLAFNDQVYASPQTIELAAAEEYGSIGEWVGIEDETPADDVTTSNEGWVELIAPVPGTEEVPGTPASTKYVYTLDTDGTVTDKADAEQGYLIVGSSNSYAMTDSLGRTGVTIADNAITLDAQPDYEWWITADGKITDGTNWLAASIDWRSGSVSVTTDEANAYSWTISHSGNGAYQITGKYSGMRSTTYYLRYSNNAFSITSSSNTVRLFSGEEVYTPATEGTPATPGTNGTYGKIVGDLTYNATVGMTAEQAMALVQGGIDGYYYEAMSTPGSDVTGTKVDDSVLTWEWVDTFDGNTAGDYEVAIKYADFLLGTVEVVVPASTTYYAAEGNGLYLVDMNTTEANAMAAVKAGVTVYSATDASGSNKTEVSDDDVTWNWVDTYNGADSGPYTVEILKDGTSLGTVEVKVNIQYETGIETDWTYIGESEATGGSYTYTLDTDGIDYGEENKYIIVDDNEAIVLNANSSSNGTAHSITISGNTATLDTRDYEYHMIRTSYNGTRYELITKGDGSQYLYQESNGVRYGTRSSVKFQVNHHGSGVYDIHDIDGTNWYIIYNGGWTVTETTSARVRLYKYTGMTGGTPGGPIYALIEGNTVYTVAQGSSATKALAAVKAGITGYTASDATGTDKTEIADSDLTWKWKNTFNGNSIGSYWVEISYQGKVLGTVEVRVEPGTVNNYPEYPDEGAVKVRKTATGVDFQSSGIAQVEVSASGVPIKKGADVILMLDTSSSMTSHTVTGSSKTRAQVLEESLVNLIKQFKTPGDDGQLMDLRVAIADFNGFYGDNHSESGTAYDRDAEDMMSDDISYNANSEAKVYTGDGTLGAGAFIPVEDLAASYTLNYTSGTNYDYAFDAIYQLGTAIKESSTEDRDLYVIFMSDGAAMQWNYYHSQGASELWNNWITGTWTEEDLTSADLNCTEHSYYYHLHDHDNDGHINEHRMATAVKGSEDEYFEVIRKTNDLGTPTGEENMYIVPGLGAKLFSISFDAQADTNVTEASMDMSIESLASEQTGTTQYYYKVTTADELTNAFNVIGAEIAYAAYNARFVDQMGDDYNLQMAVSNYDIVDGTTTTGKTVTPKIEIISYDIYTRQDYLNGTITEDKIGDRKGTYTILETVTFSADGTEAYSDQIGGGATNILADGTQEGYVKGVIYAKTFLYNTNQTAVAVEGVKIPTSKKTGTTTGSTNMLPSETFYWKMGTVQTSELAMRYYVYLTGSMEGTREGGSYPTNEFATLYYDNYLNNPCYKDTVSPVMAWKQANVSYAFYLVNEDGEIIVNQTTGQTGSFANKIAVTNPVVYETVLLNSGDEIPALEVKAVSEDVLPKYYDLYDESAIYKVNINSNTTGDWVITKGEGKVASTYVTQYKVDDPSAYSNALTNNTVGDDYTHTVVWFAIVWKLEAHPDTVVVDYGLPVDISVLTNDMFGDNGKLAAIGAYTNGLENTTGGGALPSGFGSSYTGEYGEAKADINTGKVRYTLKTMQMDSYEKFAYAVNYSGTDNPGYYYDTVTVIPATTIYYEDSFVTLKSYTWDYNSATQGWITKSESLWTEVGETIDGVQDEDRPGFYSLTDANNIYGYDSVNLGMTQYSMGSAQKATVDYDNKAAAEFTFTGTGFDVISLTSQETGTIKVTVRQNGTPIKSFVVDTYYGYVSENHEILYTYTNGAWVAEDKGATDSTVATTKPETPAEGDTYTAIEQVWVVDPDAENALYQIPVMKIENLPYGTYDVEITALYEPVFENVENSTSYDFYLDAIRIYDPANDGTADGSTDTTIEDAYKADGEGWPSYLELRNGLIDNETLGNADTETEITGLVFIDGDGEVGDAQITDYTSYGPNNEVYLAPGQRVAFQLATPQNIKNVHIGIKSADGVPGTYTITNVAKATDEEKGVKAGDYYNAKTDTIDTTTDMYYELTGYKGDIIVISNTGDRYNTTGVISLTNIKSTYTSDPNAAVTDFDDGTDTKDPTDPSDAAQVNATPVPASATEELFETYIYVTPATAELAVQAVNHMDEEPEQIVPEETVPEETKPEETVPEETNPEESKPGTEEWVAETVTKVIETVKNFVNKFFSWIFG